MFFYSYGFWSFFIFYIKNFKLLITKYGINSFGNLYLKEINYQYLFKAFIKKKLFKVNFEIKIFMYFIWYII